MKRALCALGLLLLLSLALAQAPVEASGPRVKLSIEGRGDVVLELYRKQAPRTVDHIVALIENGFYNGQRFFKAIHEPRPFLVQIGDPASRSGDLDDPDMGSGGSGTKVAFEDSGHPNDVGAVGLATLPHDRDSGDSQFYILLGPARFLDGKYTVFGKVVEGMDVVQSIQKGDRLVSATLVPAAKSSR